MPLPHLHYATLPCPVSARDAFLHLCRQPGCVWLDSARGNPETDARYSLVAANPLSRLRFANGRLEQIDYPSAPLSAAGAHYTAAQLQPGSSPVEAQPASGALGAPPSSSTWRTQPLSNTVEGDPLTALEQWLTRFGRRPAVDGVNAQTRVKSVNVKSANAKEVEGKSTKAKSAATGDAETTDAKTADAHILDFFSGGAIGYFSYELGRQWEPHAPLPTPHADFPQMDWALYDCAVVCDHREGSTHIVACSRTSAKDAAAKARRLHALLQQELPTTPLPPLTASAGNAALAEVAAATNATAAVDSETAPTTGHTASDCPEAASTHGAPAPTKAAATHDAKAAIADAASASTARELSYMSAVQKVRDYIESGDIYLTNIGQHFHSPLYEHPAELYLRLRDLNPAPYAAYIDGGAHQILSSSPELFLRKRGQHIHTRPIKGTRPRGRTEAEDTRLRSELFHSEKERAELLMIVDLERNDLGRVCEPGSVQVEALYRIETYATVHHLVADVCGTLREGTSLLELLRSTFPGGSITGAPKVRAMEIIDELEGRQRGIFCGAIGLLGLDGSLDLSIAIRTLLCAPGKDGRQVHAGVGAGLVWDSDPRQEYEETLHKAEALLKAIHAQTKPAPSAEKPDPSAEKPTHLT